MAGVLSCATSLPRKIGTGYFYSSRYKLTHVRRWFSVNMGTGIVSILLNTLPYNGKWLYWISIVIFAFNVLLFGVFLSISVLRYLLYPDIFSVMVTHPAQSLFLGTLPMGLATIINMFCFACVPVWGEWASYFAWVMWIIDAVISVLTCFGIPFIMCVPSTFTTEQNQRTDKLKQDDKTNTNHTRHYGSGMAATHRRLRCRSRFGGHSRRNPPRRPICLGNINRQLRALGCRCAVCPHGNCDLPPSTHAA